MKLKILSIILTAAFLTFSQNVQAQLGVGGSLIYSFETENTGAQVHGQYRLIELFDEKISVSGRAEVATIFNDIEDVSEFYFHFSPRAEYHFSNFFSVHAEVGFVFALVTTNFNGERETWRDNSPSVGLGGHLRLTDRITVDVEGRKFLSDSVDDFFGQAGVTFWFK